MIKYLLMILFSLPAFSAITVVAHTGAQTSTGNAVTTGAVDTTNAEVIFISIAQSGGDIPTDSKGNSWYKLLPNLSNSCCSLNIYYCVNCTVGSGHTFTVTTTASLPSITVIALSGTGGGIQKTTSSSSSATPGSITPTSANSILITMIAATPLVTAVSITGGFTITDTNNGLALTASASSMAYLIQTSATAANPTWTFTGGTNIESVMLAVVVTNGGSVSVIKSLGFTQ